MPIDTDFLEELRGASVVDSLVRDAKHRLDKDKFKIEDGLLYFEGRLYIPEGPPRLHILQSRHDFPAAGHFGFNKTMELIFQDFWWPQM